MKKYLMEGPIYPRVHPREVSLRFKMVFRVAGDKEELTIRYYFHLIFSIVFDRQR
ncbi:hypothetical protein [Dysgonomonas mossii]|uniref:hypothetical protein n=1 Tax=Dysgonomonas mossii TaxID=163665 RepID=UPI0012F70734|nr:hypothetical protein [Dysgonomonas mossii]